MGYRLSKRISSIQKEIDKDENTGISPVLAFCLSLVFLILVYFLLGSILGLRNSDISSEIKKKENLSLLTDGPDSESLSSDESSNLSETDRLLLRLKASREKSQETTNQINEKIDSSKNTWKKETIIRIQNRVDWLNAFPFGGGTAKRYREFAEDFLLEEQEVAAEDSENFISFNSFSTMIKQALNGSLLRFGFSTIIFWPLWIIAFIAGYILIRNFVQPKKSKNILGICDQNKGPFYSGIHAPLISNSSISGIDKAVPSLACPPIVNKNIALNHKLTKVLRRYKAYNETNLSLIRVILAHADFPSYVKEEQSAESNNEENGTDSSDKSDYVSFITNEEGNVLDSSIEGLTAVLETQHALNRYYRKHPEAEKIDPNKDFKRYLDHINNVLQNLSPLSKTLASALTGKRSRTIAYMNPKMIASAYLAIEAGKSLVFQKREDGFSQISQYPHLQARAVIQSTGNYHLEYNGDMRLIIRQAILCSRRHGDFGRAFLPYRMTLESRAIRDWLEILYAKPSNRKNVAQIVELDAHIEEVSLNWRKNFSKSLKKTLANEETKNPVPNNLFWKGLVYKSVVLMPLNKLLEIVLRGIDKHKINRISELIKLSGNYQANISISARLPGFKREADEAINNENNQSEILSEISKNSKNGEQLVKRWLIIRRMLTRYNWLSTRVGDDAVPVDGLVKGILVDRKADEMPEVIGLDALVPLRHRRFKELFGSKWEKTFYADSPSQTDISTYVTAEKFEEKLKKKTEEVKNEAKVNLDDTSSIMNA